MADGQLGHRSASLVLSPSVLHHLVSPSHRGPPSTVATHLIQSLASPRAKMKDARPSLGLSPKPASPFILLVGATKVSLLQEEG